MLAPIAENLVMNKLLLLLLSFIFTDFACGVEVEYALKQLSFNERFCMEAFFDEAICKDQAGHVIFFKIKPVCLTGPALKHCDKSFRDTLVLKGWQAFKMRESLFPHPKFIFSEDVRESGNDYKMLDVYIINKQSFRQCLSENEGLFKTVLGPTFNADDFIEQLEKGASLPTLIQGNEMLLGVLLGYGAESSKAFNELVTTHQDQFAPPPSAMYQKVDIKKPKGCKIQPIVFMGNPESIEVKALSKVYENELKQIAKIYSKKKGSLKMILEKLCEK